MIKRGVIQGLCMGLVCILALLSAESFLRRRYDNFGYYLPARNFWKLDLHTNLAGQFDGKEKFTLRHTGVFFDEEVVVKKPAGVKRIILLGTSSTEGFNVPQNENFASRLQDLLDNHYGTGKFEVINGAVGGYTSYQLLVYFQEVLLRLSPDIVILYLASNDSSYVGPFTARDYYERVRKSFLGAGDDPAKKERLIRYGINGLCPLYPFFAESRLFGYLFVKIFDSHFYRQKFYKTLLSPPRDQEYVLRKLVSLSEQHHFKLIFAPEMVRRGEHEAAVLPYYSLMRDTAESERISFINMTPSLRKYPDDKIFLKNDSMHLNPFGHQWVAGELFKQVRAIVESHQAQR